MTSQNYFANLLNQEGKMSTKIGRTLKPFQTREKVFKNDAIKFTSGLAEDELKGLKRIGYGDSRVTAALESELLRRKSQNTACQPAPAKSNNGARPCEPR